MAEADIQLPDGRVATIQVPEGATEQDILAFAQSQFGQPQQQAPQEQMQAAGMFDPNIVERGDVFWPYGKTAEGEEVLAVPSLVKGAVEAAMLPGRAVAGEPYTEQDVTGLASYFGAPTARPLTGGAGVQGLRRAPSRAEIKAAPTAEQLAAQSSKLYSAAEGSNAVLSPKSVDTMITSLERTLNKARMDKDHTPEAASAFAGLKRRAAESGDFANLEVLRGFASDLAGSTTPKEARLGMIMLNHVDDYVSGLSAKDLASGGVGTSVKDLFRARSIWSSKAKTDVIDEAVYRASLNKDPENALRNELRSILKNKRKRRGFSGEEKKLMEDVVKGTKTTEALKKLGKFRGAGSNMLLPFMGMGAGAAAGSAIAGPIGGAIGGVALPVVGGIAESGATSLGKRALGKLKASAAGVRSMPYSARPSAGTAARAGMGASIGSRLQQGPSGVGSVVSPFRGILFDEYGPLG